MAGVCTTIPREEAEQVAAMMVLMGRAVPATKWVTWMVEGEQESAIDSLF